MKNSDLQSKCNFIVSLTWILANPGNAIRTYSRRESEIHKLNSLILDLIKPKMHSIYWVLFSLLLSLFLEFIWQSEQRNGTHYPAVVNLSTLMKETVCMRVHIVVVRY